jgi:uncharacterized protein (TIGR00251 family)
MSEAGKAAVDVPVRLQPRAGANEIVGMRGGALVVRVTAPPVDGRANDALCRLLAKTLGVAAGRVTVVRGRQGRDKVVRVEGVAPARVRARLGLAG